ncbi:MAG TPA: lysylphosphatidylglycerol synthase transmembrane domain-containing protein [Gemmatimonadaceae bacterium]|nr:lysylphosphatidylglycerol synthase transmembrane domain-containing protein [Gemmatimonadaceae bacterium]
MSPLRWTLVALSFAAALAVSVWVVVSTWPQSGGSLVLPLRAHLLALALTGLDVATRAMKLRWGARAIGFELRLRPALRATLGGDFGGAITPSRSGTEPTRFLILNEARVGAGDAMVLLFTELTLEIVSLAVFVVVLAIALPRLGGALAGFAGVVLAFIALLGGALTIALLLSGARHRRGGAPRWASMIGLRGMRWRRLQQTLRQLRDRLAALRSARPGWALAALTVSLVHVAARISVLAALVLTVAPAVPVAPLVLWPLTLYYGAGIAPAPGGAGVVEVAYRGALGGIIPAAYLGASLVWWRFYTFYLPLLLGAVVAGRVVSRAVKAKAREQTEVERAA